MPTYDFKCQSCGSLFSELVAYEKRLQVSCPQCGEQKAQQMLTGFMVGKKHSPSPCFSQGCFEGAAGSCPGANACGCPGARS